jgi:hypothetical protein
MPEVPWDARPVFHPKMLAVGPPAVIYPRDAARGAVSKPVAHDVLGADRLGATPRLAENPFLSL